jgi:hypothetical protein
VKRLALFIFVCLWQGGAAAASYPVTVTHESQDFYRVEGQPLFIQTLACYEIVYSQPALLSIDTVRGSTVGTLTFPPSAPVVSRTCPVRRVLREHTIP